MNVELVKKMILNKQILLLTNKKNMTCELFYSQLFENGCTEEEIDEYNETRKLTKYFNNNE
jgi:hypothetical protein